MVCIVIGDVCLESVPKPMSEMSAICVGDPKGLELELENDDSVY